MTKLRLSGDPEADRLLSEDPLALLIGMVLDQQVPLEWAFAGPAELRRRLGHELDAKEIAWMDPEALAAAFSTKPALHRYPGSMAARVQELCRMLVDHYDGRADGVWRGAGSGTELLGRVRQLPGFGEQKAKIFVALLGKQFGVRPTGWQEVSVPFGDADTHRSVADITDADSLDRVRAFKQEMKARAKGAAAGKTPTAKTAKAATAKKTATAEKATAPRSRVRSATR
ncbi:MAG TPA: HhH-GPD-type base excision DNA repair protein [Acidimicrobiales bacterium]|nr:HhH-GPD-type base excision DNA repair protein [Acidimicrobiales bacterium]